MSKHLNEVHLASKFYARSYDEFHFSSSLIKDSAFRLAIFDQKFFNINMINEDRFREIFRKKSQKNLNSSLNEARFQNTMLKFMKRVRKNDFRFATNKILMNEFCEYVDHKNV